MRGQRSRWVGPHSPGPQPTSRWVLTVVKPCQLGGTQGRLLSSTAKVHSSQVLGVLPSSAS